MAATGSSGIQYQESVPGTAPTYDLPKQGDFYFNNRVKFFFDDAVWTVLVDGSSYTSGYAVRVAGSHTLTASSQEGDTVSVTFEINDQCVMPTANVKGGSYFGGLSVELYTSTKFATVFYTIDGSTPSATSAELPSDGVITLPASGVVQLRAVAISTSSEGTSAYQLPSEELSVQYTLQTRNGEYFISPNGVDADGAGTESNPLSSIGFAASIAQPGDTFYIRGGLYNLSESGKTQVISSVGTAESPITFQAYAGEAPIFEFDMGVYTAFNIEDAEHVIFDGIECTGNAQTATFEDAFAHLFVGEPYTAGMTCFNIGSSKNNPKNGLDVAVLPTEVDENGDPVLGSSYITIRNCIIHDVIQKGININRARYVTIENNIVYNVAHHSLTGGHGIMRKWNAEYEVDGDSSTADDPNAYRLKIVGNILFNIEQRVYSWVNWHNYLTGEIDEGKAILIDGSLDPSARVYIGNNLLLFNGVVNIRLNDGTHNVEVVRNSVYAQRGREYPTPSGITQSAYHPNISVVGNVVYSGSGEQGGRAIDMSKTFTDCNDDGEYDLHVASTNSKGEKLRSFECVAGTPLTFSPPSYNFIAGGGTNHAGVEGVTDLGEDGEVFEDPSSYDFRVKRSALIGLPSGVDVGVTADVLDRFNQFLSNHDPSILQSTWQHDHERSTQLLLKSIKATRPEFVNPVYHPNQYDSNGKVAEEATIVWDVSDKEWMKSEWDSADHPYYSTFLHTLNKHYADKLFEKSKSPLDIGVDKPWFTRKDELVDIEVEVGESISPMSFSVDDVMTDAEDLTVTARSSNGNVVSSSAISISHDADSEEVGRFVLSLPPPSSAGTTTILVTVEDSNGKVSSSFAVNVGGGTYAGEGGEGEGGGLDLPPLSLSLVIVLILIILGFITMLM